MHDCIIIGGGIAGLQAAIQLGRYSAYDLLVIDKGHGRSTICRSYNNILGWPEGVSGEQLRSMGRRHAQAYGVPFVQDTIVRAEQREGAFLLTGAAGEEYLGKTLLIATGLTDRFPDIPGLAETLGCSIYVCADCDGYEVQNRRTVVMGSGNPGASMAVLLHNRTKDLIYVNHEKKPVDVELFKQLKEKGIRYIEQEVIEVLADAEGNLRGIQLEDGSELIAEKGFIAFGGNTVHSELAEQLGAELEHNRHVKADPRTKMTNVPNVWIAGDLGVHSELSTVAMGEATAAAIWIHKALKKMK